MAITRERFQLALDQLGPNDGSAFESFANGFLAAEMPDLRPIGGMHDGARDAFLYSSQGLPGSFVQHSTTVEWRDKIRSTIRTLRAGGHAVGHLTYTTPRAIAGKVDSLRIELRADGVVLDIREREYFLTHVGTVPARGELAEKLARQYVDPLLADRGVLRDVTLSLTEEDERIASTYLQLEIGSKEPAKTATRSIFESVVLYVLREATPEALVSRSELYKGVERLTPASERERVSLLVDGTLKRLVDRNLVKHHQRDDAFTLSHNERVEMARRIEKLLAERADVRREIEERAERVAAVLGIDFVFDVATVASDALAIADAILCASGRVAALALVRSGEYFTRREATTTAVEEAIQRRPEQLRSLKPLGVAAFMDLVPALVEEILSRPSENIARRLRSASDAYCLLFALKETADVQGALDKVFRGSRLLVDTSIVIPCMAEQLLVPEARRMTNLLKTANACGLRLSVGEDVLNELQTHLERLVITFRRHTVGSVTAVGGRAAAVYQPLLIATYLTTGRPGSFEEFVSRFMGAKDPRRDLAEFLKYELSIAFDEMGEERAKISVVETESVIEQWRLLKRRRPNMDEAAFDTLIRHDAKTFVLVEALRRAETPGASYGHTWWWLTMDRTAYRIDHFRRAGRDASLCMSPEFFARYLSMTPKRNREEVVAADLLPISVEMAGLGLVPPDLREEAARLYEGAKDLPEYLRRRKLRELVNQAYAARAEVDTAFGDDS